MPTPPQSSLGKLGEDIACRELRRRGYVILSRRYRTRHGEIDIVVRDGDVLVFVEVKARSHERFGGPLAAVTAAKQRRLALKALDYLVRSQISGVACRFDVVAVTIGGARSRVEHLTDAFAVRQRL